MNAIEVFAPVGSSEQGYYNSINGKMWYQTCCYDGQTHPDWVRACFRELGI